MKKFMVHKDYVAKIDNFASAIECSEIVTVDEYVFYISRGCEMVADTILRHVCRIDGYIPWSIHHVLQRKLKDALARIKDNDTRIKLYGDISSSSFYISNSNYAFGGNYTLMPAVVKVIVNGPATIIFWTDGTKSVVKCQDDEKFDLEKGIAMCFARKALGNENKYHKHIREAVKMAEKYIEENIVDTESVIEKVNINAPLDQFTKEVNRAIKNMFKGEEQ